MSMRAQRAMQRARITARRRQPPCASAEDPNKADGHDDDMIIMIIVTITTTIITIAKIVPSDLVALRLAPGKHLRRASRVDVEFRTGRCQPGLAIALPPPPPSRCQMS